MASSRTLSRAVFSPARRAIASPARLLSTTVRLASNQQQPDQAGELGVGELQGAKFKIEPLRRTGEDVKTKRARLVCTLSSYLSYLIFPHVLQGF